MAKIRFYIFALMICLSSSVFAQNTLTQEEKVAIQNRVRQKVEEFQGYLGTIANIKLSSNQRLRSIESALSLFIGKGDRYSITNEYGKKESRKPVQMQLSSINSSIKRSLAMRTYLDNTYKNVHKYGKVEITSADLVRVDNLTQTGDGTYEAMAYYVQKYIAYKDGKVAYSDITGKKIKVYVTALPIPGGVIWEAKLGDVYVTSTNPTGD